MLTRLELRNYKCFQALDIRLPRLCALVGPNNSGKSSVLQALVQLGQTTHSYLEDVFRAPFDPRTLAWSGAGEPCLGFAVDIEAEGLEASRYELEIEAPSGPPRASAERVVLGDWELPSQSEQTRVWDTPRGAMGGTALLRNEDLLVQFPPETETGLRQLAAALGSTAEIRFDPSALASPCAIEEGELGRTSWNGRGLPAVLDFRKGERLELFLKTQEAFRDAFPEVEEIVVRKRVDRSAKGATTTVSLSFRTTGGHEIPAQLASEGMLLYLGYLTLLYSEQAPRLLLIEEPENGNHPRRLGQLVDVLRRISRGDGGAPPAQILMTTHSPYMLDFLESDEVLVATREPGKPAAIAPLSEAPHLSERLQDFSLGELWYNVGEAALVKGRRVLVQPSPQAPRPRQYPGRRRRCMTVSTRMRSGSTE